MAEHSDVAWHSRAERIVAQGPETAITAGFPCQDISLAGKGAGLAGDRSGLVWPLLRTIRLVRPRFAVLENVAALLGRGLDAILGRMAEIGYDAEWHCIPASAVGAPHQRDRIWIIATDAGSQQHEGGRPPLSGQIAAELSRATANPETVFGASLIGSEPHGDSACALEMAHPHGTRLQDAGTQPPRTHGIESWGELTAGSWWRIEPAVGRVADGVPSRVDRLRTLGNSVVPQIPEIIGRAILEAKSVAAERDGYAASREASGVNPNSPDQRR